MVKVYWTEAEIIQLEDLKAEGKTVRQIAEIMGRSWASVRHRHRIPTQEFTPDRCRKWEPSEVETLRAMVCEGKSNEEIGIALNRTPEAVAGKSGFMGFGKLRPPKWSEAEKQTIKEMVEAKVSYHKIGLLLKRSASAVSGMAHRMGLSETRHQKPTLIAQPKPDRPIEYVPPGGLRVHIHRFDMAKIPSISGLTVPGSTPRPLVSRKFGECAFPVEGDSHDTLYCCLPVKPEKNYCKDHYRVMYVMRT
jgi:DNA-binding CsgD family transcriptional regulator